MLGAAGSKRRVCPVGVGLVFAQVLEQPTVGTATQDGVHHADSFQIGVAGFQVDQVGQLDVGLNGRFAVDHGHQGLGAVGVLVAGLGGHGTGGPCFLKGLFGQFENFFGGAVAHDQKDGVIRHPYVGVELLAIGQRHLVHGGFRHHLALGGVFPVQQGIGHPGLDGSGVVLVCLQARQGALLQLVEGRLGKGGMQGHVGHQLKQVLAVFAQAGNRHIERSGAQPGADEVHLLVQLGFGAGGGSFGQHLAHQFHIPSLFAFQDSFHVQRQANGQARQFVVFHHDHGQSVLQGHFLVGRNGRRAGSRWLRPNAAVQGLRPRRHGQHGHGCNKNAFFHYSTMD